jgi:hypothetical protein
MDKYDIPRKPVATVTDGTAVPSSSGGASVVPGAESAKAGKQEWWNRKIETAQDRIKKDLTKEFSGKKGFDGHRFYRPHKEEPTPSPFDSAAILESDEKGRYIYRNQLGQTYHKYDDVATYLSPTNFIPRRLLVQATTDVFQNQMKTGDWRRTTIKGSVPFVLKVAEWALRPSNPDENGKTPIFGIILTFLRILLVAFPLQIMLVLPTTASWDNGEIKDNYTDFPGYHWKWPKYAINPLDMKPDETSLEMLTKKSISSRKRLLRPRQLIILKDGEWALDPNPAKDISYLFISYTNLHFNTDNSEEGRQMVEKMAEFATLKAGKTAYWLDYRCRAPKDQQDLLDADVYRMCDVIRGSYQVVVMLKANTPELKMEWGSRMWTLPEALLAPGDGVYFCTPTNPGSDDYSVYSMRKVEMTGSVWEDPETEGDDGGPTRLLAEHFTGLLTLSRLEILSNSIAALGNRFPAKYVPYSKSDIAYALMGLLNYRIEKAESDSLFQSIARLSLANDSDHLIERMICLFPDPHNTSASAFQKLAEPDLFQTHLWDITPECQVVGVADEDNTVMIDNCRALSIRWKNFPRMAVVRHYGFKKLLAELFVASGAWWFLFGFNLTITYAPFYAFPSTLSGTKLLLALEILVGGFFGVGVLLSFCGPFSVRRLYGGQVLQSSPNLIGFEGVLPLKKLEPLIFGNNNGRLTYSPSSTPFSYRYRDSRERVGLEPAWITNSISNPALLTEIRDKLPEGHKLFTLVDTGSLSVCVFSAERPPTVALLAGREGGMLRAVLCSWRFGNDCLVKESVVRMPSDVFEAASAKSWLKVCLGN